jgi:SEC-C motif-containing protein
MFINDEDLCPCNSRENYGVCCALLHGGLPAQSAETLMRSRYSAYVMEKYDYIKSSWHPSTYMHTESGIDAAPVKWLGLHVKRYEQLDASNAVVEFVARYKQDGRAFRLHEVSRFIFENGRWFYLEGKFPEVQK